MLASAGAPGVIAGAATGANSAVGVLTIANDGTGSCGTTNKNWVAPATATVAAFYEVKIDVTAGAFTAGSATGSYLDCATSRTWTRAGAGTVTFNATFREKATGIVRSTQTGLTLIVT
jgi:hypothetical protein